MRVILSYCFILVILSACGFKPLYKLETSGSNIQEELASIEFVTPKGRQGHQLKNYLQDAFNPLGVNRSKKYRLQVVLHESHQAVAVQNNNEAKRYNLVLMVSYNLHNVESEQLLRQGNFRMLGSYDAVSSSNFATLVGKQDTTDNVLNEVSRELKRRIVTEISKL